MQKQAAESVKRAERGMAKKTRVEDSITGQATGMDTKAMMPVFVALFMIVTEMFLPWYSVPVLKYSEVQSKYSLWRLMGGVRNLENVAQSSSRIFMSPFTEDELAILSHWVAGLQILAVICIILLIGAVIMMYRKKVKSVPFVRVTMSISCLLPMVAFAGFWMGNLLVNKKIGRESDFVNLTIHSYMQLTVFPYAQFLLGILMMKVVGKLLDTQSDYKNSLYMEREIRTDKTIGKRTKIAILLILVAIPFIIFFGIFFLDNRSESFIALCIIGLSMIPFCMVFEERRPQARELLLIAVMAAIAVVGRMAFFMIPQFKPVTAIVIITGVGLGAEAGFLTGAMAGFVSNFFFGQGPWTPWQMFAFGIIGFLAGLLFRGKRRKYSTNRFMLCLYGGIAAFLIYGLIMDASSVFTYVGNFDWKSLAAVIISGAPFNFVHGISTIVFLFFLAKPMGQKLDRIKKKYGILEV